jgi:hypothetical protein
MRPGHDPDRDIVIQFKAASHATAGRVQGAAWEDDFGPFRCVSSSISRRKSGQPVNLTLVYKNQNQTAHVPSRDEWMRYLWSAYALANPEDKNGSVARDSVSQREQ